MDPPGTTAAVSKTSPGRFGTYRVIPVWVIRLDQSNLVTRVTWRELPNDPMRLQSYGRPRIWWVWAVNDGTQLQVL